MAKFPTRQLEDLTKETKQLYGVLNEASDIAVVLIATSFIDECLRSILKCKLLDSQVSEKMLRHSGLIGTISARVDLCYALGLISKGHYKDISCLAEIRNAVAHHHLLTTLDTPEVSELCNRLPLPPIGGPVVVPSNRMRVVVNVALITNVLLIKALELKSGPRTKSPSELKFGT